MKYDVLIDGVVEKVSLKALLEEINRDHSEEWDPYNEEDWREGLREWTDWVLMEPEFIKNHLEYLRGEIRNERISYGEIVQLQALKNYIEDGDVELLEAAGVPEFEEAI